MNVIHGDNTFMIKRVGNKKRNVEEIVKRYRSRRDIVKTEFGCNYRMNTERVMGEGNVTMSNCYPRRR